MSSGITETHGAKRSYEEQKKDLLSKIGELEVHNKILRRSVVRGSFYSSIEVSDGKSFANKDCFERVKELSQGETGEVPSLIATFEKVPVQLPRLDLFVVPDAFVQCETIVDGQLMRPPTELVFSQEHHPTCGIPIRQCDMVELAFKCLEEAVGLDICEEIKFASGNVISFNHIQYCRANLSGIMSILINGIGSGFHGKISRSDNSMALYWKEHHLNPIKAKVYKDLMYNSMVYFFRYLIPREEHGFYLTGLQEKTLETAVHTCYRRLGSPLWSCQYVKDQTSGVSSSWKNLCKGHHYIYAVIYDRIVPKGIAGDVERKHSVGSHFLDDEQRRVMFECNQGKRLWKVEDLKDMASALQL